MQGSRPSAGGPPGALLPPVPTRLSPPVASTFPSLSRWVLPGVVFRVSNSFCLSIGGAFPGSGRERPPLGCEGQWERGPPQAPPGGSCWPWAPGALTCGEPASDFSSPSPSPHGMCGSPGAMTKQPPSCRLPSTAVRASCTGYHRRFICS